MRTGASIGRTQEMIKHVKSHFIFFTKAIAICFTINSFSIFAHYSAISKNGTDSFLLVSMFLVFPALASLLSIPLSLISLFTKLRAKGIRLLQISVAFIFSIFVCGYISGEVRNYGFRKLAERSEGLIDAIIAYEIDNNSPPKSLEVLIPKYLQKVPTTQMSSYPDYKYITGKDALTYDDNPWVLIVPTPIGIINWDMFMYFPKQNYPKRGYGGSLEVIRDWAYVHE